MQIISPTNEHTPGGFSKNEFDVYLMIGQSNMAGRGEIGALDEVPLENAYVFNADGNWENAEVPLNRYSTVLKELDLQKLNPGYTFARKLVEYTNRGIGLVVNARGGSSIDEWQKGGKYYNETIIRAKEAQKTGVIKGIIWHQGGI